MSWGKTRAAVADCAIDPRHVACVVHHVWSARDTMPRDEWEALRDYASRYLSRFNHGTINLGDVVTWMCAEWEQDGEAAPLSFRVQWAYAVVDHARAPERSVGVCVLGSHDGIGWRAYDIDGTDIHAWVVFAGDIGYTPISFGTEFLEAHL